MAYCIFCFTKVHRLALGYEEEVVEFGVDGAAWLVYGCDDGAAGASEVGEGGH